MSFHRHSTSIDDLVKGANQLDTTVFSSLREHLLKKECFLSGIARITSLPPLPYFGQLVHLLSDVKTDVLRV